MREIVANFFNEEDKDEKEGKEKRAKWFHGESVENNEKPSFLIAAPMTYRGALFEVTFSVDSDGMVQMVKDRPVPGAEWLPAPRWEVRRRPDGIHLLCLQASRRLLTLNEIQGDLENENQSAPDRITKHRRRIEERLDWSRTIKRSLVFKDVEFMEEVVLDDSLFERSLEFHECRFLKRLSLRNASVNGSLILDRSTVEGALPESSQPPVKHSLDLRGLKVERLFSFDRLTVYGQVDGKGLRAANAVYGRGLQVSLRKDIDDPNRPALDFSHASIGGPLQLDAHNDRDIHSPDRFRRTIVTGTVFFEGLLAKEVKCFGIVIGGNLNCEFSNISGGIWLMPFSASPIWRTYVYGKLDLTHASVGVLYLDGSLITGSICMVEMRARSIYARGCSAFSGLYRSWIGEDFQASGAVIDNVVEMEGAWVGGELCFITGKCGRLTLGVHPWWEGKTPKLTPCEAQGVTLLNFTIDRSINCVGLSLKTAKGSHSTWSEGGILAHDLRIGGSLLFWHSEQSKRLEQKLRRSNTNGKGINAAISEMHAKFPGSIILEGAHIEGTVNLGRTKVAGPINFTNAHVGGNFVAFDEGGNFGGFDKGSSFWGSYEGDSQHIVACTELKARNMQVGGDVDLTGLEVEGSNGAHLPTYVSVNLQDVEVGGILKLATPSPNNEKRTFEPSMSIKVGSIDLSGARASQIVLSWGSLKSTGKEFNLERCKVGQLTIGCFAEEEGFFKRLWKKCKKRWNKLLGKPSELPNTINLTAIEVGDWGVNPKTEAVALLEASHPFDARVYLDLENRLSRQGYTHIANDVFRSMARKNRATLRPPDFRSITGFRDIRGIGHAGLSWLNWLLSGNGTIISFMIFLLLLTTCLVAYPLSFPSNVDPIDKEITKKQLESQWNLEKAFGLAFSYAVPLYKGAPDIAKARLAGHTCWGDNNTSSVTKAEEIWVFELRRVKIPLVLYERTQLETSPINAPEASQKTDKTSEPNCKKLWGMSPHDYAQFVSYVQLILWILIAGNLPTIMRKRG